MKKVILFIGKVLVVLWLIGITINIVTWLLPYHSTPPATGFVVSRETTVAGCSPNATKQGLTQAQADTYCGCVYDQGVATYGGEGFTKMVQALGKTNNFTPEMNVIVNACVAKVQ